MTIESKRIVPSSVTSVGIRPSGLSRSTSRFGFDIATTERTSSSRSARPVSCATIITLRT